MRPYLVAFIFLLSTSSIVHPDNWVLIPGVQETEFGFGNTMIVLRQESKAKESFPNYTLKIYFKKKLVATHKNIGFQKAFASPDNRYFLGVSNRGLIKQAYVIFDHKGHILKMRTNEFQASHYCKMSVTLAREWYDEENPNPQFVMSGKKLKDVHIRSCRGAQISLMANEF